MNNIQEIAVTRKEIGIRFLVTLLYLIVFEILKTVIQLTVIFQFIYLFISKKYSNPVRKFSNKVATYAYKVIRYMSLNDNIHPFPFNNFPDQIDQPDKTVTFE